MAVVFALSAPFGFPCTGRGFDNLVAATQPFDIGAILACYQHCMPEVRED